MFSLGNLKNKIPKRIDESLRKKVNRVILFTNVRDEKNMKEWIAHHLLIGFDIIYIFDHKSKIPLAFELQNFDKRVIIERWDIDGSVKLKFMNRAKNIANFNLCDWMCYLDADEFLVLNAFQNVKEMLVNYSHCDLLAINWLMFGTNYHKKEPQGLIIDNYTKSDLILNKHVKSFVRPSQIIKATNPHYFNILNPNRMFAISNQPLNRAEPYFHDWNVEYFKSPAFVAHYVYQAEEVYIKRKIVLPTDDTNSFRQIDNSIHEKHNITDNTFVQSKYSENIKGFLTMKRRTNSSAISQNQEEYSTDLLDEIELDN
jgi:hypothetical protein